MNQLKLELNVNASKYLSQEKAKKLITQNLSNSDNNKLLQNTLIIGPELWKRYKDNKKIQAIEKGRVEFHVDNLIIEGKMSQDVEDTKIIWEDRFHCSCANCGSFVGNL
jgi:hypothetical protein